MCTVQYQLQNYFKREEGSVDCVLTLWSVSSKSPQKAIKVSPPWVYPISLFAMSVKSKMNNTDRSIQGRVHPIVALGKITVIT